MSCKEIKELLPAYLEKLVSVREEETIREHLARCPDCKAVLEDLERTNALVQTLEDVEPPPFLSQRIMADVRRLQQEKEKKAGFWKKIFYPLHIKVPIQALATALIVLLAVQVYRTMEPAQVAETLPMQNQVMTPAETNNTKPEAIAPFPAAPSAPAAVPPSVQKPERATVSSRQAQSLAKAEIAPKQIEAKADSATPEKDAAMKPAAEEPRMKNQAAPPRAQAMPQVAEKSAPAGAMMEAYQAAPSPTAADREASGQAVNADKSVARKAKKLSAGTALMGAVPEPTPVTPKEIAMLFLKLDYDGARLSSDSYVKSGIAGFTVSGEYASPGWDIVDLVKAYEILSINEKTEYATVTVQYDVIGDLSDTLSVEQKAKQYTFRFKRLNQRWFMIEPYDLRQHISIGAAIRHLEDLIATQGDNAGTKKRQIQKLKRLEGEVLKR